MVNRSFFVVVPGLKIIMAKSRGVGSKSEVYLKPYQKAPSRMFGRVANAPS